MFCLKKDFGFIRGYNDAPHPHPESFMVGNGYQPNISKAKSLWWTSKWDKGVCWSSLRL